MTHKKHAVRYIIAIALCVFTVLVLIFALLARIKDLYYKDSHSFCYKLSDVLI